MLHQFLGNLIDQASMRLAIAGDGDGNLEVSGRPNYILAQLGGVGGALAQVHTSAVHPNDGDFIYVIAENPTRPGGWRHVFWLRDGGDAGIEAPIVGSTRVRTETLLLDDDGATLTDDDAAELVG